jgi:hypothetical protein
MMVFTSRHESVVWGVGLPILQGDFGRGGKVKAKAP